MSRRPIVWIAGMIALAGLQVPCQGETVVLKLKPSQGRQEIDESAREVLPTKRLWAMGKFSRFLRPGSRRFDVEHDSTVLQVVACKSHQGGRLVMVVMNPTTESVTAKVCLAEGTSANILDAYEASVANDLKHVDRKTKDDEYRFPDQSVTTLIVEGP